MGRVVKSLSLPPYHGDGDTLLALVAAIIQYWYGEVSGFKSYLLAR